MPEEYIAETQDRLHGIVEPVVEREGYVLVELRLTGGGRGSRLQVVIDRPGRTSYVPPDRKAGDPGLDGVGIRDCAVVSRALSPVLDVEDVIDAAYDLEVSSPGINRPLTKPEHFKIAEGMRVRVKLRIPIAEQRTHIATLVKADDEGITLEGDRNAEVVIPYRHIRQARLDLEF